MFAATRSGRQVFLGCLVISFIFLSSYQLFTNEPPTESLMEELVEPNKTKPNKTNPIQSKQNPLDGCLHVYLDMGTNRGVQIRKLYERQLFPSASVIPVFEKFFGRNKKDVCAVGFEPHPAFSPGLQNLASHFNKCGLNVKIYKQTAVTGRSNGEKATFKGGFVDGHLIDGTAAANRKEDTFEVETLRISEYVNNIVATRKLPPNKQEVPHVLMKLDVEGEEIEILPDLVMNGALLHLDMIMVDFHTLEFQTWADNPGIAKLRDSLRNINELARTQDLPHVTEISEIDDETYGDYDGKFTTCKDILKS